jgi:hypothetical protein
MTQTYIDQSYLTERVRRYNENPSDDLLYRIGSHTNVLTLDDTRLIDEGQSGRLNPEQRFRVLDFLSGSGHDIKGDLALLIFGHDQLSQWLEISKRAYPDFDFYLVFEAHPEGLLTGHKGIDFTMHWMPKPGAPEPSTDCDFPWSCYWEHGGMFWGDYPGGFTNQFDFNVDCYPNQWSFATPNYFCEAGDRYTTPTDEEANLMPVEAVLNGPALNVR